MTRLIVSIVAGLMGAAIVHIVTVLAVPRFSRIDIIEAARELGGVDRFAPLPSEDPMVSVAACAVFLDEPIRVFASGAVPFWSVSVFTQTGTSIYSTNDRTARDGTLDFIALNSDQLETLREELSEDAPELVALPFGEALVVLRVLVPDETFAGAAAEFIANADCAPLEVGEASVEQ